jgi:photosystem II stability/assembly factor-like uncharacterized protein
MLLFNGKRCANGICFTLAAFLLISVLPASSQRNSKKPDPTKTTDTAPVTPVKPEAPKLDDLLKGLKYREIGPFRGGRSLTAAGIPGDPNIYYFGATGGGVWKSTDGAMTWQPIFDDQGTSSIGSVALAPSDPNVVYVGTGEACIRGNISHGDGVYKSVDGGKTWKNTGLKDSRAIGRVIVNPKNPDIAYVAALGHPFGPNQERGVFRTMDGGKTWEKVLYKDENTGAIDIAFDPHNANILFASLWEARRTPWTLSSGGLGSGLYRSNDAGATWKRLEEHGLPKGPYGRIGVAVAANSDRVYALIEANEGGLYRSDDGGGEWQRVNPSRDIQQRFWYYGHVTADPVDPDTVYFMNVDFYKSTDGGRSLNKVKVPHGDNHGLWIDPLNTRRMIASNDGGVSVTLDGGKSWSREDNQPTAQFYHVITDTRTPYRVYGAQQDNSTIAIASRSDDGGIGRADWYAVGGGEAGYIAPYPPDPFIVYAGDYQGTLTRYDRHTGQTKSVTASPELSDGRGAAVLDHRFQWTAPLMISPHDPETLYHAGERLFKTTDGGMHWEAISDDLTRNDKTKQQIAGGPINKDDTGTEYYDTIFAVAESPVAKDEIWAGTDDGLVQLTRDGGKHWTNVTPKELPEWSRISLIEASPRDAGTAYVAVDRHQNDDYRPYIFKTTDFGATWTKLVNGIPNGTFVRAVREDPKKPGLLFAGAENGVYVSFNNGADWKQLKLNLPTVPVHDLVIKDDDLVVATHGRAFWILDDIAPLREFTDATAQEDVHLFTPAVATRYHGGDGEGRAGYEAKNPPTGAVIDYFLKMEPKTGETTTIEILDASGQMIRKFSSVRTKELEEPLDPDSKKPEKELEPKAGLNRFVWDMLYDEARKVPGYYFYEYEAGAKGPMALPGRYQVRLTSGGKTQTAPFELRLDPRVKVSAEDLQKQFDLRIQIREQMSRIADAVAQIDDVRAQSNGLAKRLADGPENDAIRRAASDLDQKLLKARDEVIEKRIQANEDSLAYPARVDIRLAGLAYSISNDSDSAPTEPGTRQFEKLKKLVDGQLAGWAELQKTGVLVFQKLVSDRGIAPIVIAPPDRARALQQHDEP